MNVEAKHLTVRYGRRTILRDVDFKADAGKLTVILGPNGSGKTTLLKALSGDLPFDGEVRLNDVRVEWSRMHELAARRGVLAQETPLSFPFTVAEVVRIGLTAGIGTPRDRDAAMRRVAEALAAVDLSGFSGRFYQELSGGERQRVQLARVLCQIWEPCDDDGPRWLFLDEPVSSLDIRHQIAIMELAGRYARRGGGVIAIMHDLNLTAMFADRVVLLAEGRVVAAGSPGEVLRDETLLTAYGCRLRVGITPPSGMYVLPHSVVA